MKAVIFFSSWKRRLTFPAKRFFRIFFPCGRVWASKSPLKRGSASPWAEGKGVSPCAPRSEKSMAKLAVFSQVSFNMGSIRYIDTG